MVDEFDFISNGSPTHPPLKISDTAASKLIVSARHSDALCTYIGTGYNMHF